MTDAIEVGENATQGLIQIGLGMALNLTTAVLVLFAGIMAAKYVRTFVDRRLRALPGFDRTLIPFIGNIARYLVLTLTFVVVLSEFGVQTTSIIAVLGAAGLAIGLALQGTLSNVASGLMLLILRPFQIGDYVEAGGTSGTVDEIGLFVTSLRTPQNIRRVVPNSKIFGGMIANYNAFDRMRVDLEVGISYDDDIAEAINVLRDVVTSDERFLSEPPPQFITKAMADSSINLEIRAWVAQGDFFSTRFDLTREVKLAFDKAGISIPYPHRQIVTTPSETPPQKTTRKRKAA